MPNQYGIRRRTVPRVRTTYPVASASVACVVRTVRSSLPGTVTVAGASTVAPAGRFCASTVTVHGPVPPRPESVSCTERVREALERITPKLKATGLEKIGVVSARGRLITPPPPRSVGTSSALRSFV